MSSSDNDPTSMPDPELPLHTTPEPIGELCGVRSKYTDLWYANPTSKSELWSRRKNTFPTGGVAAFYLVIYSVLLLCIYLLYSTPFLFFFSEYHGSRLSRNLTPTAWYVHDILLLLPVHIGESIYSRINPVISQ